MDLMAAVLGIVAALVAGNAVLQLMLVIWWRRGSPADPPLLKPAVLCQALGRTFGNVRTGLFRSAPEQDDAATEIVAYGDEHGSAIR